MYVIHAHKKLPYKKLLAFFPYKKLLCSHTQKITIHYTKMLCNTRTQKLPYKNASIFPIQKITYNTKCYVIHAHKNYHTKITSIFPIQKLHTFPIQKCYVIHAQKLPYKNYHTFFPIQKLLCSARTQNCHTKMLVFSTHTKILCNPRKKLLVLP